MNIGLLGGTFNPPHLGHLLIARQVLDYTDCDAVWFVPGYKHTFHKPAVAAEHRIEMLRLLLVDVQIEKVFINTVEIDHQLDGHTINLLPLLPNDHQYRFIIGSDQLPTFHFWGEWQSLLRQLPFLVFPRYGYPNEPLYPGMSMVNDEHLVVSNISSTKIRDRVKRGLSIDLFTSLSVEGYINKHSFYQA